MDQRVLDLSKYWDFFDSLERKDKDLILSSGIYRNFNKGEILVDGERECMGLVLVLDGQIRAYTQSEDGKEITLFRLLGGDSCALSSSCMMKDITFTVNLVAEQKTKVFNVPSHIYEQLNNKYIAVKNFTMNIMNSRFSDCMQAFELFAFKNLTSRLASALIEHYALKQSNVIDITHDILARDMGTAREVVSRALKQFEDSNLIKLYRGKIEILDIKGLYRHQ